MFNYHPIFSLCLWHLSKSKSTFNQSKPTPRYSKCKSLGAAAIWFTKNRKPKFLVNVSLKLKKYSYTMYFKPTWREHRKICWHVESFSNQCLFKCMFRFVSVQANARPKIARKPFQKENSRTTINFHVPSSRPEQTWWTYWVVNIHNPSNVILVSREGKNTAKQQTAKTQQSTATLLWRHQPEPGLERESPDITLTLWLRVFKRPEIDHFWRIGKPSLGRPNIFSHGHVFLKK